MRMMRSLQIQLFLLAIVLLGVSCAANSSIANSGKTTPTPVAPQKSSFEQDLESVKVGDFKFIFVLRRKDGAKLDADDKKFVRTTAQDANRFVLSEEDKAIITGSNFPIAPEKMKALQDRFDFQDITGNSAAPANVNSNTNKMGK